jgi:hypothetical protein
MKKLMFILALVLLMPVLSNAQTEKDVVAAKEMVWFGLDYSKAVMAGDFTQFKDAGEITATRMRNKYYIGWNDLVMKESKKYNLNDFYLKESVVYDLESVNKSNSEADLNHIFSNTVDESRINSSVIAKMVSKYHSSKTGIGLVYIVDNYNKSGERGVYWVVFFDIKSKKVLKEDKFVGSVGGFGVKNYWARSILDVMEQSRSEYKKWSKKLK